MVIALIVQSGEGDKKMFNMRDNFPTRKQKWLSGFPAKQASWIYFSCSAKRRRFGLRLFECLGKVCDKFLMGFCLV